MNDGNWRRRHAIQIAAQLPENPDDALAVLDYARQLVEGFLRDGPPRLLEARGEVLPLFAVSAAPKDKNSSTAA